MLQRAPHAPTVPEWPATVGLTDAGYPALLPWLEAETPTAELSYLTLTCWHGAAAVLVSRCGGFLLLLLADPVGHVIVVGGPDDADDAETIVPVLRDLAGRGTVTFVPPRTAMRLAGLPGLQLELDRDNSDYLLDPRLLASYTGPGFAGKRKQAERFGRRHAPRVLSASLSEDEAHDWIADAFDAWLEAKVDSPYLPSFLLERDGVRNWPRAGQAAESAVAFALFDDGRPIGISVVEKMWGDVWMGVTLKTLPSVSGATEYLRRHVAGELLVRSADPDCVRWNIQQDTGSPGLRAAKTSYHPTIIVPKYRLSTPRNHTHA